MKIKHFFCPDLWKNFLSRHPRSGCDLISLGQEILLCGVNSGGDGFFVLELMDPARVVKVEVGEDDG